MPRFLPCGAPAAWRRKAARRSASALALYASASSARAMATRSSSEPCRLWSTQTVSNSSRSACPGAPRDSTPLLVGPLRLRPSRTSFAQGLEAGQAGRTRLSGGLWTITKCGASAPGAAPFRSR